MLEFMVEIVITALAFGGILGAVIALHLSANLKQAENTHKPTTTTIEPPHNDPVALEPVPVDTASHRASSRKKHHH